MSGTLDNGEAFTSLSYLEDIVGLLRSLHQYPGAFNRRFHSTLDNAEMHAIYRKALKRDGAEKIEQYAPLTGVIKRGNDIVIDGWSLQTFLDLMLEECDLRVVRFQVENDFDLEDPGAFDLLPYLERDPNESLTLLLGELEKAGIQDPEQLREDITRLVVDRWATMYTVLSFYRPGMTTERCKEELETFTISIDEFALPEGPSTGLTGEFLERKYLAIEQVMENFFPDSGVRSWEFSSFRLHVQKYRSLDHSERWQSFVEDELLSDQFFEMLQQEGILSDVHFRLLQSFRETPGYGIATIPVEQIGLHANNTVALFTVKLPEILVDVIYKKFVPERAAHLEKELAMGQFLRSHNIPVAACYRNPAGTEGLFYTYTSGYTLSDLIKKEQEGTYRYDAKLPDIRATLRALARMHVLADELSPEQKEALNEGHDDSASFKKMFDDYFGGTDACKAYSSLTELVAQECEASLIHGSAHLANFITDCSEDRDARGITILDLETVQLGPAQVDLFKLLEDTRLGLSSQEKEEMVEYYLQVREEASGREIPETQRDCFYKVYDLISIGEHLKVVGMFDRYAKNPLKTYSQDSPQGFRLKASHHFQNSLEALDRSLQNGYDLSSFREALLQKVITNERLRAYAGVEPAPEA